MRIINTDDLISINIKESQINKYQPKHILVRNICNKMQSSIRYEKKEIKTQCKPYKKYEIYKIIIDKDEEIFVANKKDLPFLNKNDQELYFDKNISIEICKIYRRLNNSTINSCPEIKELYEKEIYESENEIEKLRRRDELFLKETTQRNNLIRSGKLKEKVDNYDFALEEKKNLQKQIKKYKLCNQELMKRLKISLEKYEELKNKKMSFFERIIYSIKKKIGGENNENIYC